MNRILLAALALLVSTSLLAQVTTSTRFGFQSVNDPAYGAACGTTTDDSAGFKAALDAAAAAGGGTVYVPACPSGQYYYFTTNIEIPSNVDLVCQKGTVLKQRADGAPTYQTTGATGLVGFYGVTNASIQGCTLDSTGVATATDQANPIEVRDATPNTLGSGTRSSFITVEGNTVSFQNHAGGPYGIWIREADDVRVTNNRINGNQATFAASSDQQGIETVAVERVEISGNHVSNVGRYGIYLAAFSNVDQAGYWTRDVNVHSNTVIGGKVGIAIEAADAGTNVAYLENARVAGNVIRDPWERGIRAGISGTVTAGEVLYSNVLIEGNAVSMTELSQNPTGFNVEFGSANPVIKSFTIANNIFHGGKGATNGETCMRLVFAQNLHFSGNRCDGGDVTTDSTYVVNITSAASKNNSFVGNYFGSSPREAWYVGGGDDYVLSGNTFNGYNALTDARPAMLIAGTTNRWVVTGNKFIKDTANAGNEGYLTDGTTSLLVDWTWANNSPSHTLTFNRQNDGIWDGSCSTTPGNSPQFGCVTINTGAATATVTNPKVRPGSRIYLNQTTGDPVAARAAPGSGSFVVTLAANCATANCTFFYEVMQ